MTPEAQRIFEQAKALPEEERAELVNSLLDTLPPEEGGVLDEEWDAEIARRVADYESGNDKGVLWEDVRERLMSVRKNG